MAQASLTSPSRAGSAPGASRTHVETDPAAKKYMETIRSIKRWLIATMMLFVLFYLGMAYLIVWFIMESMRIQAGVL